MPTAIVAYATNADPDTGSYLDNAARAARECLDTAGVSVDAIGALINVGIYRDDNLVEPAVSALLQQRIGMGLTYRTGAIPAFSFDLMNGACGLLDAIAVAESFFAVDSLDYVLLTAGDAHPSTQERDDFPYANTGAALLLGRSDDVGGFGVRQTVSSSDALTASAVVPLLESGAGGRSAMRFGAVEDPLEHAVLAVRRCAAAEGLKLTGLTVLAPAPTPDFGARLGRALGLAPEAVLSLPSELGDPHSAAPIFALADATVPPDRPLVLVAADGPVASCICYRPSRIPAAASTTEGH